MDDQVADVARYPEVAVAFDSVAADFDRRFENDITRRIRDKIYSLIKTLVSPPSSILDINCGTGIDAIALAKGGYAVDGIDVSLGMIQEAERKSAETSALRISFTAGSFHQFSERIHGSFDLAFSNFGGLNCTDDLAVVAEELSLVLKPGGYFMAVVMPPFSLWEFTSYALRGQLQNSLRRIKKKTPATGFDRNGFTVFYHSPQTMIETFAPWFVVQDQLALSILSPTPQSTGFAATFPGIVRLLEWLDSKIERWPGFRSWGDHVVLVFRKL